MHVDVFPLRLSDVSLDNLAKWEARGYSRTDVEAFLRAHGKDLMMRVLWEERGRECGQYLLHLQLRLVFHCASCNARGSWNVVLFDVDHVWPQLLASGR